jgi:hypothetical protein
MITIILNLDGIFVTLKISNFLYLGNENKEQNFDVNKQPPSRLRVNFNNSAFRLLNAVYCQQFLYSELGIHSCCIHHYKLNLVFTPYTSSFAVCTKELVEFTPVVNKIVCILLTFFPRSPK